MTFNKNQEIELHIDDMSVNGEGIGHADGMTFFVKDAVIHDDVRALVTKVKKNYCYARLLEVITPSEYRVEPPCPVAKQCGACTLLALSYDKQLELKSDIVRNNLIRLGGFDEDFIRSVERPIVGMDNPYHFRNKSQFPVGLNRDGHVVTGFYGARSHNVVPIESCATADSDCDVINAILREYMTKYNIRPYDESTGGGVVRHILIRKGFATGEIMVCLVVNFAANDRGVKTKLPNFSEFIERVSAVPGVESILLNENTKNTNVILGDKTRCMWGRDYITDKIGDVSFEISAKSFYQVNPVQTEKLYTIAKEYANLSGSELVWDLYCGIGTISLFVADSVGEVYGIEVVRAAIDDAIKNAELNGVDNAHFFCGKTEDLLPAMNRDHTLPVPDVVIVDPPRKGCDLKALDTIIAAAPKRIVYVSCDSATLARDLRILCDGGYELSEFTPVDQFCHSMHTECVVLLQKLSNG